MDDELKDAIHSLHVRLAAVEAEAGTHRRDPSDLATHAAKEATDSLVSAVDRLDRVTTSILGRLETVEKYARQNVPYIVSSALEPVVDEIVALENKLADSAGGAVRAAKSADEARNAAASHVRHAETSLTSAARHFAHGRSRR